MSAMSALISATRSSMTTSRQQQSPSRTNSAKAAGDQGLSRRIRHRPGRIEKASVGRGLSALQTARARQTPQRHRAAEIEYPTDRPDRNRQNAACPDARPRSECSVLHCRCDQPDRGWICRRGRREYSASAAAVRRQRCRKSSAGNHLHRRDRQDLPQGRQPVDHARCLGRRRPAGTAKDSRGHCR